MFQARSSITVKRNSSGRDVRRYVEQLLVRERRFFESPTVSLHFVRRISLTATEASVSALYLFEQRAKTSLFREYAETLDAGFSPRNRFLGNNLHSRHRKCARFPFHRRLKSQSVYEIVFIDCPSLCIAYFSCTCTEETFVLFFFFSQNHKYRKNIDRIMRPRSTCSVKLKTTNSSLVGPDLKT